MTPPLWTALATVGLALSTFVADEAFAFAGDTPPSPFDVTTDDPNQCGRENSDSAASARR